MDSNLINDIKLCNNIYDEYKNQSIKTYDKFQDIFNKYKSEIKNEQICNQDIQYIKIICKFYRYNNKTNKFIVPIFYKTNKFYIYNIIVNTCLSPILSINFCNYYNNIIRFGNISGYSPVIDIFNWARYYKKYQNQFPQYKNKKDFIIARIQELKERNQYPAIYNVCEFKFIPFKYENELIIEKNIQKLESKVKQLELSNSNLKNNNKQLNEKLRECQIEIHYLKSCYPNKKVNYNYQEIKQKNKQLNSEFKRVAKLMKLNK